jgi:hypothetical protein
MDTKKKVLALKFAAAAFVLTVGGLVTTLQNKAGWNAPAKDVPDLKEIQAYTAEKGFNQDYLKFAFADAVEAGDKEVARRILEIYPDVLEDVGHGEMEAAMRGDVEMLKLIREHKILYQKQKIAQALENGNEDGAALWRDTYPAVGNIARLHEAEEGGHKEAADFLKAYSDEYTFTESLLKAAPPVPSPGLKRDGGWEEFDRLVSTRYADGRYPIDQRLVLYSLLRTTTDENREKGRMAARYLLTHHGFTATPIKNASLSFTGGPWDEEDLDLLVTAGRSDHEDLVGLLILRGAEVTEWTVSEAIQYDRHKFMNALIENGIQAKSEWLDSALEKGSENIAALLLDRGLKPQDPAQAVVQMAGVDNQNGLKKLLTLYPDLRISEGAMRAHSGGQTGNLTGEFLAHCTQGAFTPDAYRSAVEAYAAYDSYKRDGYYNGMNDEDMYRVPPPEVEQPDIAAYRNFSGVRQCGVVDLAVIHAASHGKLDTVEYLMNEHGARFRGPGILLNISRWVIDKDSPDPDDTTKWRIVRKIAENQGSVIAVQYASVLDNAAQEKAWKSLDLMLRKVHSELNSETLGIILRTAIPAGQSDIVRLVLPLGVKPESAIEAFRLAKSEEQDEIIGILRQYILERDPKLGLQFGRHSPDEIPAMDAGRQATGGEPAPA